MDILEEAKSEMRQQKLCDFIRKYYKAFLVLVTIILVVVSSVVYLNYSKTRKYERLSKQYYDLFVLGKISGQFTDATFGELIKFRDTAFMTFAEFQYVDLALKNGKHERAVQILLDLIRNTKTNSELSNVMKIRLAGIVMQYNLKVHQYKTAEILVKATKTDKAPYYHIMRLLLGQILLESNRRSEALTVLNDLHKNSTTPEDVKFFSGVILSNYLE